jgi:hypothetical protein
MPTRLEGGSSYPATRGHGATREHLFGGHSAARLLPTLQLLHHVIQSIFTPDALTTSPQRTRSAAV